MTDLSTQPAADNPATPPPQTPPPVVDVQAQIDAALAQQAAGFASQFEQATGHKDLSSFTDAKLKSEGKLQELADSKTAEAAGYRAKFEQQSINNELLTAASDALDADVIMALLGNKAVVDATGKVTVEGKTAKEAVADLLKAKPHLAKASGAAGSGAPNSTTQSPPTDLSKLSAAQKMAQRNNP